MNENHDNRELLLNYLKQVLTADDLNEVYFGYAEPLPEISVPLNFMSRMTFSVAGASSVIAAYDGKIGKRQLLPGKALFTGRNGWAWVTKDNPHVRGISVVFMESYIRLVYGELSYGRILYNPWYHTTKGPQEIARKILDGLNRIMFEKDTDRQRRAVPLIKALAYQVIEDVEHELSPPLTRAERTLKRIMEYTQQAYHTPVNRASISAELKINPSSLSRIFKENTGTDFNAYLNQLRMEKAEFILKNYDLPVEKVADQCGFTSSNYFIKAFKKYFGTTPGKFRSFRNDE
ncbi:MAG: AraC family transcriptional regulator [Victivallaceae bacterium]|nr:AraC family transcriptional regulator [Victivallaceae bacterium]